MTREKRKRDLFTTLHHIERYHRRRMVLTGHVVLSLAVQFAVWANWYASYAARGVGFENNFFADRIIISVVLMLFLIGHAVITRLTESKDRAIVQALLAHDTEEAHLEASYDHLADDTQDDFAKAEAPHRQMPSRR